MRAAGKVKDIYTSGIIKCPDKLKNYIGNKKVEGLYHQIISIMPPHSTYVEPFAGSAAIYRYKRPSKFTHLNDLNPSISECWSKTITDPVQLQVTTEPALVVLNNYISAGVDTLIYIDPPYIINSRLCKKSLYDFEMSDLDHVDLLNYANKLNCRVVISHYPSSVYDEILCGWNIKDIYVSVRGQLMTERIYFNFPEPVVLHDYRYLGKDRTDRQRIRRKLHRLLIKLQELPEKEKNCIIEMVSPSEAGVDNYTYNLKKQGVAGSPVFQ